MLGATFFSAAKKENRGERDRSFSRPPTSPPAVIVKKDCRDAVFPGECLHCQIHGFDEY